MSKRHEIRRLAMQVLYQLDLRGQDDAQTILENLPGDKHSPEKCQEAFELAMAAWVDRAQSDASICKLASQWPTHRQPPLDRAILRLACYELATNRVPKGVCINEAIILAKQFCSEQSPGFINGVLDKIARERTDPV